MSIAEILDVQTALVVNVNTKNRSCFLSKIERILVFMLCLTDFPLNGIYGIQLD
jgi:hypothetical protein